MGAYGRVMRGLEQEVIHHVMDRLEVQRVHHPIEINPEGERGGGKER